MTGADSIIAALADRGVELCFANPGTSEMHFLAALERQRMRSVLCLFEGVATGAADGWYRMKETPASTLLHLGPGLANGLVNVHNARRASSGMVNVVGDHAGAHLVYDPPLASDIEGLARPLSHWVRRADSVQSAAWDAASAADAASAYPGQIATLIVPGEVSWQEAKACPSPPRQRQVPPAPSGASVASVARALRSGEPTLLVLAGRGTRGRALEIAGRISAKTGCRLGTQFLSARIERGAGRVPLERIPYAHNQATAYLGRFSQLVTVETDEPIAFFSYPNTSSRLRAPGSRVLSLVERGEDAEAGLAMLADAVGATSTPPGLQTMAERIAPSGELSPLSIAHALTAAIPENCIVVDESLTSGRETMGLTLGAAPHDLINNMGGAIGYSTPVATGAALACPDRRVLCLVGDGSAMYTIQSLWTHARENLNVTTIVFANSSYAILKAEFANMGAGTPGPRALAMMDIDRPRIDWCAMAKSMGVSALSVDTAEHFTAAMIDAVRQSGPSLIEVNLNQRSAASR